MKEITLYDAVTIEDAGKGAPRYTSDGYVTANVRAARVGIQDYRGSEIGRPDLPVVRVYRPAQEVFHKDSLSTYAHRPLTNDHPPQPVNADNWKQFSIGMVGDEVARDGDFVRVPMVLMDHAAIKDFQAGKKQLSLGYTTVIDWSAGVTEDGQAYDAVQTQIRANHLAMVTAARGGPMLKIGDSNEESKEKQMKIVQLDGLPVNTDDHGAMIIDRVTSGLNATIKTQAADIEMLKKQLADAQTAQAKAEAEGKKAQETKDAEIDVLKKQVADTALTPAKLDQLVADRAEVVGKAQVVLGDKLVVKDATIAAIKKQVVDAKMGAVAAAYSEDAYTAAFNALTVDVKPKAPDALADTLGHRAAYGVSDAAVQTADADKAWEENNKRLTDAWKNKAA